MFTWSRPGERARRTNAKKVVALALDLPGDIVLSVPKCIRVVEGEVEKLHFPGVDIPELVPDGPATSLRDFLP